MPARYPLLNRKLSKAVRSSLFSAGAFTARFAANVNHKQIFNGYQVDRVDRAHACEEAMPDTEINSVQQFTCT